MKKNGINYLIDKRMVALDIIMLLDENYYQRFPFLKAEEYPYLDEVRIYFKDYIHHKAVEFFHNRWEDYAYDLVYRKVMNDESDELVKKVNAFIQEAKFRLFFENHLHYFERVLENNLNQMADIDMINALNKAYTESSCLIEVYFSFVSGGIGYNISQTTNNKIVLGVYSFANGMPIFLDNAYTLNMIFHECSHRFINPIVEELTIDDATILPYFQKLHPKIQKMYGAGKSMIAEQFVRGFTLHFLKEVSQELYEKQKEKDISFGMELGLEIADNLSHSNYLNYADYIKEMVSKLKNNN